VAGIGHPRRAHAVHVGRAPRRRLVSGCRSFDTGARDPARLRPARRLHIPPGMSLPKRVAAALVTSFAGLAVAVLAPALAHADEGAPPAAVSERLETPAPELPADPARAHLVLSADLGLTAIAGHLGVRYQWLEVDLGLRGASGTSEKFGAARLLLRPDGPIVPFVYAEVGQWTTTVLTDATPLATGHPADDGVMIAGGFGIEVPMGRVATLSFHFGLDHQDGNDRQATRVDAAIGFGLRI
jgi:hypothetical protein